MDYITAVGNAWAAYYRPGMSSNEARAFIAGFEAAHPGVEYAWRDDTGQYWPFSSLDDGKGTTFEATTEAASAE